MKFLCLIALFISHSTAQLVLPCTYMYEGGFYYSCEIQPSFTITSSAVASRTISSASGIHDAGKTNADVVLIKAVARTINYMPLGVTTVFPNIRYVAISNSNLLQLLPSDLAQFPQALTLQFPSNKLTTIPAGLFAGNQNVTNISFSSNLITCVAQFVFTSLNNLSILQFASNPCYNNIMNNRAAVENAAFGIAVSCPCAPTTISSTTTTTTPTTTTTTPTTTTTTPTTTTTTPTTTTSTVSPCIIAEQNQTIQFNNTIASLRNELTATINAAVSGLCTAGSCSSLSTSIANLNTKLTAFIAQTNNNFQNSFAALNNITLSINAVDTRLRRFERSTYGRLDELQRRCCRRRGRSSSS